MTRPTNAIPLSVLLLFLLSSCILPDAAMCSDLPPILDVWDFADPARTQRSFEALAAKAEAKGDPVYRAEALTQIARCQGLQGNYEAAKQTLAEVEQGPETDHPRVRVRLALERGRILNSSGSPQDARPHFGEAWLVGVGSAEDYLAVDAAHMIAIVAGTLEDAIFWTEEGAKLASVSQDDRVGHWLGPLHNNLGWRFFNDKQYEDALREFQLSLDSYRKEGDETAQLIARYSLGRTLRHMGRTEEAVQVQTAVDQAFRDRGEEDGYVLEELAEGYSALGNKGEAQRAARRAYELLSKDSWFAEHEADRLARLKSMGNVERP